MSKIIFFKVSQAQQTREQICTKIAQIDALIESLYNTAITSVSNGNIAEYEIDTGQTKNKVKYSSLSSVTNAIESYEMLRQMLQNKLSPKRIRLMDSKNANRRR